MRGAIDNLGCHLNAYCLENQIIIPQIDNDSLRKKVAIISDLLLTNDGTSCATEADRDHCLGIIHGLPTQDAYTFDCTDNTKLATYVVRSFLKNPSETQVYVPSGACMDLLKVNLACAAYLSHQLVSADIGKLNTVTEVLQYDVNSLSSFEKINNHVINLYAAILGITPFILMQASVGSGSPALRSTNDPFLS